MDQVRLEEAELSPLMDSGMARVGGTAATGAPSCQRLTPAEAFDFHGMTFPAFSGYLMCLDGPPRIIVGARIREEPVGLALAAIDEESGGWELLSVFVEREHRRKGIGTMLVERVENEVADHEGRSLKVVFESAMPNTDSVAGLLRKRGFPVPAPRALVCRFSGPRIREAPFLKKVLLPSAFQMFRWVELSGPERQAILRRHQEQPWYPDILSPFREEGRIEPLNSLGLRFRGEVVGWQINHRLNPETIRYTAFFVREDLQPFGLAIPLLIESIKGQVFHESFARCPNACCVVPDRMGAMTKLVKRVLGPFADQVHESLQTVKIIPRRCES